MILEKHSNVLIVKLYTTTLFNRVETEELAERLRVKIFLSSVKDNFNISEGILNVQI